MLQPQTDFKEQMAEARRIQILMGAAQVFSEKGFHKATTKEIAKAAGVSEGTIYNYFDNKRDLLVAMVELLATQSLKDLIATEPPADPKQLITVIMHDRYQLAKERGHQVAPIIAEIFNDVELREALYQQIVLPTSAHLEKFIQAQVDSGRFRPIDPIIATRALIGAIVINFALKISGLDSRYDHISVDSLVEQLVTLFLEGLVSRE